MVVYEKFFYFLNFNWLCFFFFFSNRQKNPTDFNPYSQIIDPNFKKEFGIFGYYIFNKMLPFESYNSNDRQYNQYVLIVEYM